MHSDDVFEYTPEQDQDPSSEDEIIHPPPVQWEPEVTLSTAELVAIYQLQKAGFVPSDFE